MLELLYLCWEEACTRIRRKDDVHSVLFRAVHQISAIGCTSVVTSVKCSWDHFTKTGKEKENDSKDVKSQDGTETLSGGGCSLVVLPIVFILCG